MILTNDYTLPPIGEDYYTHHKECPESGGKTDRKPRLWIQNDGNWVAYYCHHCGEKLNRPYRPSLFDTNSLGVIKTVDKESVLTSCVTKIPGPELQWLFKYHITPEQIRNHMITYSPKLKRIVFPLGISAVCRSIKEKPKWLTDGAVHQDIMLNQKSEIAVLVEDIVSAIRVFGSGYSVMPLFGTSLSKEGKTKLITEQSYSNVVIWLDLDATNKANKIYKELCLYVDTSLRFTEKDPKEYTDKEIRSIIAS